MKERAKSPHQAETTAPLTERYSPRPEFTEAVRIAALALQISDRDFSASQKPKVKNHGFFRSLAIRAAIMVPAVGYFACGGGGNEKEEMTAAFTPETNPTPTRTIEPTEPPTPTPLPEPTSTPTPEPTPVPTPNPANLADCRPEDSKEKEELYAEPAVGTRKRPLPYLESEYDGRAARNTKLSVECQRTIGDMVWYRVSDAGESFWIPQIYTSDNPVPVVPKEAVPPPVQQPPEVRPGGGNKIVLTFDDSGPFAQGILDAMAQYGAKGIFFPNGNWANANPALIERMKNEGHLVCNHTYSHANLTTLSSDGVRYEISNGAGVGSCNLLRPPYGAHNASVDAIAAGLGYQIYMWDIDTRDWARRYDSGDQEILNIVLSQARPGAVVLMHMHVDQTSEALPKMLEGLKAAGYELSW